MTIQYCEITIIMNQDGFFKNITNLIFNNPESYADENSDIVILFDDKTIYNVKDSMINFEYHFVPSTRYGFPIYFEKKDINKTYFYTNPTSKDGELRLSFNIFEKEIINKYKVNGSIFNCIYTCRNKDVLSILKIYSNNEKPRYLLAYEIDEFTKDEIIYLVNCIFKREYENVN